MLASWEMPWPCKSGMIKRLLVMLMSKLNTKGITSNCCKIMSIITKTNFGQINFKAIVANVGAVGIVLRNVISQMEKNENL
jgi:hypothetical protein